MNKPRRFDLYPDDFLAAVSGEMTPAELGVYWMICMLCYSRGGPIAYDLDWLRAKFTRSHGLTVVKPILDKLIASGRVVRDGNAIGVRRVSEELANGRRRVSDAMANGRRGGRPSKETNDLDKGSGFPDEKLPSPSPPSSSPDSPLRSESDSPIPPPEEPIQQELEPMLPVVVVIAATAEAGTARAQAESMVSVWQQECGDILSVPLKLDTKRVAGCNARWGDSFGRDIARWVGYCRAIRALPFCCGDNDRGWRADFDWALTPKAIRSVQEGKYERRAAPSSGNIIEGRWGSTETARGGQGNSKIDAAIRGIRIS